MNEKLITIIIPVYNNCDSLNIVLDSLIIQCDSNIEIIVIDDGSTDDFENCIKQYTSKIKVVKEENHGVSVARNLGIKNALGKYIMFIDSDDYIDKNLFKRIEEVLNTKKSDLITFGYEEVCKGKKINSVVLKNDNDIRKMFFANINTGVYWMAVWNKVYVKSIAQDILFNESYTNGEDFDFNIRYLEKIKFQNISVLEYIGYYYNIEIGNYKYRKNTIDTRIDLTNKLQQIARTTNEEKNVNYYFWNAIVYDLLSITKNKKLEINEQINEFKVIKNNNNFKMYEVPENLSKKKKLIIKSIKSNYLFAYIFIKIYSKK